jgi:hypothetical protein
MSRRANGFRRRSTPRSSSCSAAAARCSSRATERTVQFWERFTFGYLLLLVVYTWYLFVLLLAHDVRPRRTRSTGGEKIAVRHPLLQRGSRARRALDPTVLGADVAEAGDRHRRRLDERRAGAACASWLPCLVDHAARVRRERRQAGGAALRDDAA